VYILAAPIKEKRSRDRSQPITLTVYGSDIIPEPIMHLTMVMTVSKKSLRYWVKNVTCFGLIAEGDHYSFISALIST
jgi:hypothetical protein